MRDLYRLFVLVALGSLVGQAGYQAWVLRDSVSNLWKVTLLGALAGVVGSLLLVALERSSVDRPGPETSADAGDD